MRNKLSWLIGMVGLLFPSHFQSSIADLSKTYRQLDWVNTTYSSMSLDQKIGQLFMVRAYSKGDEQHERLIKKWITEHYIGGLCFFQGDPKAQVRLTNHYQAMSRLPLMISIDAEWGLGMRFKDKAISFPKQMTMGAIRNNKVIYDMGVEVAHQLKSLGVHMNFAPVVDINNNPANPVINVRSFGENKQNVTAKSYAYMKGMQDNGVLACAKHFPGHGDTDVDSHKDLPIIAHDLKRLDSLELFPFKVLSQFGIAAIMVAHLEVPALEKKSQTPTTLSYSTITEKLKKELGFQGLIITDALDMKGVTKHYQPGELEVLAFQAGNDILLLSEQVELAIQKIKASLENGQTPMSRLEESVKKVLTYKYQVGLTTYHPLDEESVYQQIITAHALGIKGRIYEEALTCVKNDDLLLPLNDTHEDIGALAIGVAVKSIFQRRLESYTPVGTFTCSNTVTRKRASALVKALEKKKIVIISLQDYSQNPHNHHGIGESALWMIRELSRMTHVILVGFGSPYVLGMFEEIPTIVHAYEGDEIAQDFCAQALFGVFDMDGLLPITASPLLHQGTGVVVKGNGCLGYVLPEVVGMYSDTLDKIDTLVQKLIGKKAAPGCQVLIARRGKIVYHKAFGYHDYKKGIKVQLNDLYDIASLTKVAATTLSLMKLVDEGKFDIHQTLGYYLPELDTTDKGPIVIADVLAHCARLPGWIPFFESTLTPQYRLSGKWYRRHLSDSFHLRVTEDLFLRNDYYDTIFQKIATVELRENPGYRYSDLGFYLFERIIKKITGLSLDEYSRTVFYDPMGLHHLAFNPLQNGVHPSMVPPTEEDDYFRREKIQGYVHDMGAAMQGGVAGHAGLFSNAHDLAVLFQMLLKHGTYAGKPYLSKETIDLFTHRHPLSTRRGLGFDMKELDPTKAENMCSLASKSTFGHLGFTGTCVWADPEKELIFVFLSNRTYPSMKNNTLHKENYRPKIQCLAYHALMP